MWNVHLSGTWQAKSNFSRQKAKLAMRNCQLNGETLLYECERASNILATGKDSDASMQREKTLNSERAWMLTLQLPFHFVNFSYPPQLVLKQVRGKGGAHR